MGGRGAEYSGPNGSGGFSNWSNGLGSRVADTVGEALGRKGAPIAIAKAYKDANPNFDEKMTYSEFTENCQRCIIAYEMRRRGYDVTAMPTYEGDVLPTSAHRDANGRRWGRWMGAFRGARPEQEGAKNVDGVLKNIKAKMKSYGPNARTVVQIKYAKANVGHVFNVESRKGTLYFVDAQTGDRLRIQQFLKITDTNSIQLVRTDNLRPSARMRQFVTSDPLYKRAR